MYKSGFISCHKNIRYKNKLDTRVEKKRYYINMFNQYRNNIKISVR